MMGIPDRAGDFWGEPIHVYTRADAIEDGVLVDVSELAKEAGFKVPVAITAGIQADVQAIPESHRWQDETGRLWDLLFVAADSMRRQARSAAPVRVALSNGKVALVDADEADRVRRYTWHQTTGGYAVRNPNAQDPTRYLHRLIMDAPTGCCVDHVNGDPLDNRKANLRLSTASRNQMNADLRSDSVSGCRGVSWDSRTKKWRVRLRAGVRDVSVGRFATIEEAAAAYAEAANRYHGEYARQNRPHDCVGKSEILYDLIMPVEVGFEDQYTAKLHIGPGDEGEPVVTILRPEED